MSNAETNVYLVNCGEVEELEVDTDLPSMVSFGRDWLVVEAADEAGALAAAAAVDAEGDAGEVQDTIHARWTSPALDRLGWHLLDGEQVLGDERMFIRFGAPRRGGQSANGLTGRLEAGLSAYMADEVEGGYRLDDAGIITPTALFLIAEGARPYLVAGVRVGTGSDGEPLLASARLVCPLDRHQSGLYTRGEW